MPVLCAFAPVEIFMINSLNIHISEVLNKEKKKPKKKKLGKSNIALMMQKEQCITEAAWILKVILHSAANNFKIIVENLVPPFVLLLPTCTFSHYTSTVQRGSLPG